MKDKKKENIEIEDMEKKLEESEKQSKEYLTGWQRARADFLNYKKEEIERIESIINYANEEFILELLPIVDNFEIIEKGLADNLKEDNNIKGILLLKNQILNFLKKYGIEEIKAVGEEFNPGVHEATEEVEKKDCKTGTITEEIQKGYIMKGKILRPSKVKVAK
ncbi:MAG: nucleotide exchange factor GrpE [Candidatus Parcubacteria bacterium]|nr:nucleotide exchange factor GrpE [Candidatus Parcubacteria bacterium]